MEVTRTRGGLAAARPRLAEPVGAVLTMGALHAGHRSLLDRARAECASVIATIFVNPTQFGPAEDLTRYPRDETADLAEFEAAGVDVAFVPPVEEIYPPGFGTTIDVGPIAVPLEGAARPGHFRGVATVVAVLLGLTRPQRTYFGQKDAQQCLVVRRLVADLALGVEVVVCPTVREPDGLALSSRNRYLSPDERRQAVALSRALFAAEAASRGGEHSAGALREVMYCELAAAPLGVPDYVSVADAETLEELETVDRLALASLAVRFPSARLIDNVTLSVA